MSSRSSGSMARHVAMSAVRMVPCNLPSDGMAFAAYPAFAAPNTRTVPVRGSTRRLSRPGRSVMSLPIP